MYTGTSREDTGRRRSSANQGEEPTRRPQDLTLPASALGGNQFLLFKPPSRGYFVRWPAPTDTGTRGGETWIGNVSSTDVHAHPCCSESVFTNLPTP